MPDKLLPEPAGESPELRDSLAELIPGIHELEADDFKTLAGLMRRQVMLEHQEAHAAQNIVAAGDQQEIRRLAESLPFNNPKEIAGLIDELALDPEESEIETLNWAFRHQSVSGDFLAGEDLIAFRLVRMKEHTYILLCRDHCQQVVASFTQVFGRDPAVHHPQALRVEDHTWVGYAWFMDPDQQASQKESDSLRALWDGIDA
jgi:hypothetical protein